MKLIFWLLLFFPLPLSFGQGFGPVPPGMDDRLPGERQVQALAAAYPARISRLAVRDGEWALRIDENWYYWAEGRLLPEDLRDRWREFASYRFYTYRFGLPPLPQLDEAAKKRLKKRLEQSDQDPPRRHGGFLGDLFEAQDRGRTEAHLVQVELMGFPVSVHERIAGPLASVDEQLQLLALEEPQVRLFLEGLKGLAGYNWRSIAGTRSRSYHSYGLAIDLMPKSFGGKHTYWRWVLSESDEWYAIPYARRWMVPLAVVEVFENHGFVWGGKWFFFDTMHFEYRPEILVLTRRGSR